jgi:Ca-activated chloride channel homolog
VLRSRTGAIRIELDREGVLTTSPPAPTLTDRQPEPVTAIKVDVRLVNLNVKVTDQAGRPFPDLQKEHFLVFEDGIQQTVSYFEPVTAPTHLLLLLDLTGSTREKMKIILKAAARFVDTLGPQDNIAVAAFTQRFLLVSNFTHDRSLLKNRIHALKNRGSGTAFYDAMWSALDLFDEVQASRKAIVVMTDGVDSSLSNPDEYPAKHQFEDLLARAAERDSTIYPVYLDTEYDVVVRRGMDSHAAYVKAFKQLEALVEQTGGTMFRSDRVEDLEGAYQRVASELRTLYSLGYTSSNAHRDGRWRKIEVKVDRAGAVARTRPGYYAK